MKSIHLLERKIGELRKVIFMNSKYRTFLIYAIPLIVSLAICIIISRQEQLISNSSPDNIKTFYSFTHGFENYKTIRQEWRPRIFSNFSAGIFAKLLSWKFNYPDRTVGIQYISAYWTAIWFLLICLLFILTFKEKSLFYIFGVFAGISFAYTPLIGITRIYPWDMPALLVFCTFITLIKMNHHAWLIAFIPLTILFKETSLILVVAFLFWENVPLRKKLRYLGITLILSLLIKTGVDLITSNPSPIITMSFSRHDVPRIISNLELLFALRLDSAFFIDAGLLLALLLLPISNRQIGMLKLIAGLFIVGTFFTGVINEYRIWFELIPISLFALDLYFSPDMKEAVALN